MNGTPILPNVDRDTIVRVAAGYLVIVGLLNLCGGIFSIAGGGILAATGAGSGVILSQADGLGATDPDVAEAIAATSAATGGGVLLIVVGFLSIISAPVAFIVAWGLFGHKAWSRMGAVIVGAILVVTSLASFGFGFSFVNLVTLILSAVAVYMFYTDDGIKRVLSQ